MIIVMEHNATKEQLQRVTDYIAGKGMKSYVHQGDLLNVVAVIGDEIKLNAESIAALGYAPKVSITLDQNLILNAYIPKENTLKFTFDGKDYSVSELAGTEITLDDGKQYYKVSVELHSPKAAREVVLLTTVDLGGKTAEGKFTFSIPKYAEKVLVSGTDTEKTLVRDVLAYVKAAYNYFTKENSEEEIARVNSLIDSIIGADYNSAPTSSGETNTVSPVNSVTLILDATPTIRFYVTDTSVKFYRGNVQLKTVLGTDDKGTFVDLDVYAYALCETITYGEGGSYHVTNYLAGADESEKAIVKAFIKYTESAAKYRSETV